MNINLISFKSWCELRADGDTELLRLEQIAFKFNRRFAVEYWQKVWQQKQKEKLCLDLLEKIIP